MACEDVTDRVNLFVGTAGDHGQLYPGAETPFGLVKPAPDTYPGGLRGTAHTGYDFNDGEALGFSHTRVSGTGCRGVGANVLIQPTLREDAWTPEAYRAPMDKATESASPGFYSVAFADSGIRAELTATDHVGLHRYVFPPGSAPRVVIDLARGLTPVTDARLLVMGDDALEGELTSDQMWEAGWYRLFFRIRFSRPFRDLAFRPETARRPAARALRDGTLVARASFAPGAAPLMVQCAVSCVSRRQARRFLEAETPDWDFERVREAARRRWAETLGRIEVEGGEEGHRTLFHTFLYRVCHSPFAVSGPDGLYMGEDGQTRTARGRVHYNGWSLWDTYRTKTPLLALLEPSRTRDMMDSLVATLTERLDETPEDLYFLWAGFLGCPTVRLEMANAVLLDAWRKGVGPRDTEAAWGVASELARREFSGEAGRLGYVPGRPDVTCEFAYDNWAAAEMARLVGRGSEAAFFDERGRWWRHVWDDRLGFFRARGPDGEWLAFPSDPTRVNEAHVYEGSAWHWRWAVVHDIAGVAERLGGRKRMVAGLERFYEEDLHNHGNEPSIHAPWLFAALGAPWLTQKWVRRVLTEPMTHRYGTHGFLEEPYRGVCYRNAPDGLIPEMDDDDGCMSAWYCFSSLGLYPLCVGRPVYALGSPLFERSTLRNAAKGTEFRLECRDFGRDRPYVQSATLNGRPLDRPWLTHEELVSGGRLEFEMGSSPSGAWGGSEASPW